MQLTGEAGTVTKAELAALLGVSKPRISQLVKLGLPVRPDGRVDQAAALAWCDANLDPNRRRAVRPPEADERRSRLADVRAEAEAERLRGLRLENERRAGNLVDRQAAEAAIFARARLERDAWLGWAARAAPALAAELDADQDRLGFELERLVRQQLAELADTPLAVLTGGGEGGEDADDGLG